MKNKNGTYRNYECDLSSCQGDQRIFLIGIKDELETWMNDEH